MSTKYIFNSNMHGYEHANIDDFNTEDKSEDTIIIIIDKSCDTNLGAYYQMVTKLLKRHNKVVLIGIEDGNKSFKPLASLLFTFNEYNIYKMEEKDLLSADELAKICERQPDYDEVQTFVGGDITAYSELSTILFGIESLVNEGNSDKIKEFLGHHLLSIEAMTTTLNNMKKICDMFNSDELILKIKKLKETEVDLNKQIQDEKKAVEDIKYERDKMFVEVQNLKRENKDMKQLNEEAKDIGNVSVIKTYSSIDTKRVHCKTKNILYFKEISYVPYVNSLVFCLCKFFEINKKFKLVIYDSQTNLYSIYGKFITPVSGVEYPSMKNGLISKTQKIVVTEPNMSILQDILVSDQCFDIVVVYDRLKSINDIVIGNNVAKFYVINSSNDYDMLKTQLKITDLSHVITHGNSRIGLSEGSKHKQNDDAKARPFLDIPYIESYDKQSESSRLSLYKRLRTSHADLLLLDTILSKARIEL